ncbi:hypothetical protein KFU94_23120 [Chloroflexi bacterium TSY]|nr:hypothetical protein [Chloroflexi bacterium TSY]
MNKYRALFDKQIQQSLQEALAQVQAAKTIVPDPVRRYAWHILSYALRLPDAWPLARDLLLNIAPKMEQEGWRDEWIPYLEQGVEQSRVMQDHSTCAALCLQVGYLHYLRGRYAEARRVLTQSLSLFLQIDDLSGQTKAVNRLGWFKIRFTLLIYRQKSI